MVGIWRKRDADGDVGKGSSSEGGSGEAVREASLSMCPIRGPCSSSSATSAEATTMSATAITEPTTTPTTPTMVSTAKGKERLEEVAANDDVVVKESTDSLSVVVDWLVGFGGKESEKGGKKKREESEEGKREVEEMKMLSRKAVDAFVGGMSSSSSSPSSVAVASSPSLGEQTKDSKGTDKDKDKAELTSKADLERFYVSLARRMYDEGL